MRERERERERESRADRQTETETERERESRADRQTKQTFLNQIFFVKEQRTAVKGSHSGSADFNNKMSHYHFYLIYL